MDERKRRRPVEQGKRPEEARRARPDRRSVRTPEDVRTSARTEQRRRAMKQEKTAMKIKERQVSPTPVKRRRTPAKPEDYARAEQPKRRETPGRTVHETDAARRRAKFEKYRRKRRILLVVSVLVVTAALLAGLGYGAKVLFQVDSIVVTGETRYSAEDIRTAAGITTEDNLLLVQSGRAASSIYSLFPYLGRVKVYRRLPDKVEIVVEEAVPACVFEKDGQYLLVSDAGRILEKTDTAPDGLFCVHGLELTAYEPAKNVQIQDPTAAAAYEEIADVLEELSHPQVTDIDFSDIYDISMRFDDRILMKLGSPSELRYKIRFGVKIVTNEDGDGLNSTERGTLDLSLTPDSNKAYFTPEPTPPPALPEPPDGDDRQDGPPEEAGDETSAPDAAEETPPSAEETQP